MTQETFEETLRALMRQQPFQSFTIELTNGGRIEVDAPESVAWGGGVAGYLSPIGEPVFFNCKDVSQISTPAAGTAS